MSSPQPPLEAAWQTLRSSLEWAQEFGLVFVFCSDIRAKQTLFERANDLMQAQVRPFQRPEVHQANTLIERLLPLAVNSAGAHVEMGMPLWLDLDGHPGDMTWDQARQEFLLRLNERRATLAREHTRTVVLALPLDWTKRAAEAAPDLWTIRQPSVYLDAQMLSQSSPPDSNTRTPTKTTSAPSVDLPEAVLRWQANRKSGQTPLSLWDATQASEAALASGHHELAWQIIQETVKRVRASTGDNSYLPPERLRDLSVAVNKLGEVALALGRLDEAQQAFRESEKLDRTLIDDFGKSPERLRDLSVSVERLGDVALALGWLDEAQQAYRESEKLHRSLIDDFGKTPERLRDLSVSVSKLGDVALALGRLDEAQQAFRESKKLHRSLIDDFGKTPERLRDLSVSMSKLGDVARALGRLDEAQRAFRESERLRRSLIDDFGKTPERLRDLSVSMERLGNVALALGRLDEAQHAFRENEKLHRTLIDDFGKTPERLRDLSVSMSKLGDVARALGRLDEAQQAFRESEKLHRTLIDDFGKTPERLRDLSVSMERLGDVALALGRLDEAQLAFEAEIQLAKDLIQSYGETATALEVLAYGEMHLGHALADQGLHDLAKAHHRLARRLYRRLALAMPHDSRYKVALEELGATGIDSTPGGDNS